MVIDTVTSPPPVRAIGYQCLPLPRFQEDAVRGGGSEHYHGRLMGVNCGGRSLARVRPRVANVAHSILCHVDDGGGWGGDQAGALTECQSHFGQTTLLSV